MNLVNRFGPAIAIGMEFGYTFTKFQSPPPFIGSFEQKVKTFGGGFLVRNYLAQGKPLEVFLETGISVVSAKTSVLLSSTGIASNLAFGAGLSPAVSYTVPGVRFVAYPGGLAFVKVLDGESDFDVGWFPTAGLEIVY